MDAITAFLLYFLFPLWVAVGFADYLCHRVTQIELTAIVAGRVRGIREMQQQVAEGLIVAVADDLATEPGGNDFGCELPLALEFVRNRPCLRGERIARNTEMPFAICSRSTSTSAGCRPTTRLTDSTTWRMCSARPRSCSKVTSQRRAR